MVHRDVDIAALESLYQLGFGLITRLDIRRDPPSGPNKFTISIGLSNQSGVETMLSAKGCFGIVLGDVDFMSKAHIDIAKVSEPDARYRIADSNHGLFKFVCRDFSVLIPA